MSENKFYLNCPYSEKDLCKTLGAKSDEDKRQWYVPEGVDRKKFKRIIKQKFILWIFTRSFFKWYGFKISTPLEKV